jgi:hypothetical protein
MTSDFSVTWQFYQREQLLFLLRIKLRALKLVANVTILYIFLTKQWSISTRNTATSALKIIISVEIAKNEYSYIELRVIHSFKSLVQSIE